MPLFSSIYLFCEFLDLLIHVLLISQSWIDNFRGQILLKFTLGECRGLKIQIASSFKLCIIFTFRKKRWYLCDEDFNLWAWYEKMIPDYFIVLKIGLLAECSYFFTKTSNVNPMWTPKLCLPSDIPKNSLTKIDWIKDDDKH